MSGMHSVSLKVSVFIELVGLVGLVAGYMLFASFVFIYIYFSAFSFYCIQLTDYLSNKKRKQ